MVIIGAKGLAKELLVLMSWDKMTETIYVFDNVNHDAPDELYGKFPVIKSWEKLQEHFLISEYFVLGIGGSNTRKFCFEKASSLGGVAKSLISGSALIGDYGVCIGEGTCVLSHSIITADVIIGKGCLVNKAVIISHDAIIGDYCEISPGAKILGAAQIGHRVEIGTNAVILPGIKIADDCSIGAGAVVTKDTGEGTTVTGVPAKER